MPDDSAPPGFYYQGFSSPNGTIVPDDVFDVLMSQLSDPELRVLLYIIRRTFGFKKNSDNISLKQMVEGIVTKDGRVLDRGAGVSKASAARGVKGLADKGIILAIRNRSVEKGDEPTTYALRFRDEPLSLSETRGAQFQRQGGVSDRDTQQTVEQETGIQQTESSSRFELQTTHKHNKNNVISKKREISKLGSTPAAAESERRSRATPTPSSPPIVPPPAVLGRASRPGSPAPGPASHRTPRRGRPPQATVQIAALIEQFSGEFHDEEHTKPNISQAARLWKASGLSEEAFCQRLFDARARTLQAPGIEKRARGDAGALGLRNKMPYYFIVLRDVLGMRDDPAGPSPTASS